MADATGLAEKMLGLEGFRILGIEEGEGRGLSSSFTWRPSEIMRCVPTVVVMPKPRTGSGWRSEICRASIRPRVLCDANDGGAAGRRHARGAGGPRPRSTSRLASC